MDAANSLLIEATTKLIELHADPSWGMQLPTRCPPVLWFGNSGSPKPKVVTVGANPSRSEFLSDSSPQALATLRRLGDQSRLHYLEPPKNRFHVLGRDQRLSEILAGDAIRDSIIASYNAYFNRNPYTAWFGHGNRDPSYKVEGFLRGFGASYYDGNAACSQAIHIDLFPFATLDDFGKIKAMADTALFANGWAQRFITRLVELLTPEAMILFGRTNCGYFADHIDESMQNPEWQQFRCGEYFIGNSDRFGMPIVGLSTNLGNPKGFDAKSLFEFGVQARHATHG